MLGSVTGSAFFLPCKVTLVTVVMMWKKGKDSTEPSHY
jgi:hypothetical protein